ncbi:MAG: hypothetical protein FWD80_02945 [Propionibacteriaceae bacterium]|nr:hypothetical protein [Propionibacteriaceae bacterium]
MFTIKHRVAAGFAAALLLSIPLSFTASPAHADPSDLLNCTNAGDVFVVVTSEDGVTTSACVKSPASGTAALQSANVTITRDDKGMICALNNYPDPCPATFNGKYWQYYEASGADAAAGNWAYATTGSDDTKPQPGTVEGWCYGEQCTPVYPGLAPSPSQTPTGTSSGSSMPTRYIMIGVTVVIFAGVAVSILRRRPASERQA